MTACELGRVIGEGELEGGWGGNEGVKEDEERGREGEKERGHRGGKGERAREVGGREEGSGGNTTHKVLRSMRQENTINVLWQHTLWNKVRVTSQCVNVTH